MTLQDDEVDQIIFLFGKYVCFGEFCSPLNNSVLHLGQKRTYVMAHRLVLFFCQKKLFSQSIYLFLLILDVLTEIPIY